MGMNGRERFLRTWRRQSVDRVPFYDTALWAHTLVRWLDEGLPRDVTVELDLFPGNEFFGLERIGHLEINADTEPPFEHEVIEETERYITTRRPDGQVRKSLKEGMVRGSPLSMDHFVDHPIHNRADFEELKKRFDPSSPARYPEWWTDVVRCLRGRDYPLRLLRGSNQIIGFFGKMRAWMGFERTCLIFRDDPKLAHEMLDFICDFGIAVTERALRDVEVDLYIYFEDMAYNAGPMVSPKIFREFFVPRYRRFNDHLRSHGVEAIVVDSDGDCRKLIPMWIETGINGLFPLERAAHMHPAELQQEYGRDLVLWGGVDKRVLALDQKAIDRELQSLAPVVEKGGYIPMLDHAVPPDVAYPDFLYYLEQKRKLVECRFGA